MRRFTFFEVGQAFHFMGWCMGMLGGLAAIVSFAILVFSTASLVPFMGREFMPELEEGNIWVQAAFPMNSSLAESSLFTPAQGRKHFSHRQHCSDAPMGEQHHSCRPRPENRGT
jgi:multidrug efflux pump subunit AcrB